MKYLEMKKRAFMSIVNAVKGFVRTISGIPPITLPDCVDNDSLINYSISGNSVQNGTPTPENPIEVESVGDLTTKNLIDKETISTNTYFKRSGDIFISNRGIYADSVWVSCNVNDLDVGNYVLSADVMQADITTDPSSSTIIVGARGNSKTIEGKYIKVVREEWVRVSFEFTLTEFLENFCFKIQPYGNSSKFDNLNLQIKNIQLEKGDTMTEYEPFGKYKIPIKMSGKNLFNINNFQQGANNTDNLNRPVRVSTNGEITFGARYAYGGSCCIVIPAEAGETITFSWERVSGDYYGECVFADEIQSNGLFSAYVRPFNSTAKNITSFTVTQREGYHYIGFAVNAISAYYGATIKNLLVEKSNVKSEYEPYIEPITTNIYLDEPLAEGQTITNPVKLPTIKGTTIYTIETTVQPSNMSAEYYSTTKGE